MLPHGQLTAWLHKLNVEQVVMVTTCRPSMVKAMKCHGPQEDTPRAPQGSMKGVCGDKFALQWVGLG